jgi:magnesium transporter
VQTWTLCDGHWQPGDLPGGQARWFHVCAADGDGNALDALGQRFGLHPLAIDDCRSPEVHRPKVNEFSDHLFIVLVASDGRDDHDVRLEEVDIFLGADFLITYIDDAIPEFSDFFRELADGVGVRPGPDGLLYELADRLVDGILPEVNQIADQLDAIEERIVAHPGSENAGAAVIGLRARGSAIRRAIAPQLAVMQRLSRGEFRYIGEANRVYFRDVYDHLMRVDASLESVREDGEVVLSTYLSALNNRMSEVMKVLSVVAALALPATVITGIFGTNFESIPGLQSSWGFGVMLAGIAGVAAGMAIFFKRRGWW